MFRGAAIAQIIPVALLPIISRLYGPEVFGVFTSVLAIASVLAVIGALRLEIAIVLPEREDDAQNLQRACLRLAAFFAGIMLIAFLLFHDRLNNFLNLHIGLWLCAAPLIAFIMTLNQIGTYAATRHHDYNAIASATIWTQIVNGITVIVLGLIGAGASGLVAGRLFGQAGGLSRLRKHFADVFKPTDIKAAIQKNKKFPLFNLPYSLIGSFTREFIVLTLTAFHYPAAAGFYGMARAAILLPVSLVTSSIGQVFYREAARSIDHPAFPDFAFRLMRATACLAAPAFVLFTIWATAIFGIVFGDVWATAGIYAMYFAPVGLLFMMSSWPERVFEVRGRQEITLMLQIIFDGASIVAVLFALMRGYSPLETVAVFVAIQCLYHLAYIGFVFRLLNIPAKRFGLLMLSIVAAGLGPYVLDIVLYPLIPNQIALFALETAIVGGACLYGLTRVVKNFAGMPAFVGNDPKAS